MSLFFTQGHRGVCSKTRLIAGPPGPIGPTGPRGEDVYVNIILDCKTSDGDPISSTPLQSLNMGKSFIFLKSPSTLIFTTPPKKFSVLFESGFRASSLSFSLLDVNANRIYELIETKIEPNLFTFHFTEDNPTTEYILEVNGSAIIGSAN
jgi:hypothetical protein